MAFGEESDEGTSNDDQNTPVQNRTLSNPVPPPTYSASHIGIVREEFKSSRFSRCG